MRTGTAVAAALAAVVTAGGGAAAQPPADAAAESDERNESYRLRAWAMFSSPDEDPPAAAVTYDPSLVPQGARVEVEQRVADGRTTITLGVSGVRPGHTFGAHVHTDACGARPADSGPHYRNIEGDDPALANPANEVWLDVTADGRGAGRSTAVQEWTFRPGEAASVVLHEHATSDGHAGHGAPGEAGDRVACVTVPFGKLTAADRPAGAGQGGAAAQATPVSGAATEQAGAAAENGPAPAAEPARTGHAEHAPAVAPGESAAPAATRAPTSPGGGHGRGAAVIGRDGALPSGPVSQRAPAGETVREARPLNH
ncbi:hypothetical protein [Streptomyces lonarensis]|uniref:hypothetical protein n=1 Tax=Streptomyces lonarensis TaxID=700599 RepID=UPI001ADDDC30|nr:hypothetical protein [Streptomyces lonarensis]